MMLLRPPTEPSASSSSAELQLVLRHPDDARTLTEQQLGWLSLGLRGDPRVSLTGLLEDIEIGMAQLWAVQRGDDTRALVVTRIIEYELCDCLEIQICGGVGMWDWMHLLGELEQHARNMECKMMELRGRPGWQRMLPGYRVRGIALEKEL